MPEPKNEAQDIGEQYLYIEECENDTEGYYWSIGRYPFNAHFLVFVAVYLLPKIYSRH